MMNVALRRIVSCLLALPLFFGVAFAAGEGIAPDPGNPESYIEIEGEKDVTTTQSGGYTLRVDTINQVVSAYRGAELVRQMICSSGTDADATPLGTFPTGTQYRWGYFTKFDVWAQYWTRIDGPILFHSVLFQKKDESTLISSSVNNLGRRASHGCIRLRVIDAKWIFDNCPSKTPTIVFEGIRDSKYTAAVRAKGALEGKNLYKAHVPSGKTALVKTSSGGGLKVRAKADSTATVVTTLANGQSATIVSASGEWSRIYHRGTVGYVSSAFLQVTSSAPTKPSDGSTPSKPASDGMIKAMGTIVTNGGTLNMRAEPNATSTVLLVVPNGAEIGVIDDLGSWVYAFYQGQNGYFAKQFVLIDGSIGAGSGTTKPDSQASAPPKAGKSATVATPGGSMLNMRLSPDMTAPVVIGVPNGTKIAIEGTEGEWVLTTYNGTQGYLYRSYLVS